MPSGAKKRKAAKKKKEQAANNINPSTNNNPLEGIGEFVVCILVWNCYDVYLMVLGNDDPRSQDERNSDGGDAGSPASHDGHNHQHSFGQGGDEERSQSHLTEEKSVEETAKDAKSTERSGLDDVDVKIVKEWERNKDLESTHVSIQHVDRDKSSSTSSNSSSDDESQAFEKMSNEETCNLGSNAASYSTEDKSATVLSEEVLKVAENNTLENVDSNSAVETVAVDNLVKNISSVPEEVEFSAKNSVPDVVESGLKENEEKLLPSSNGVSGVEGKNFPSSGIPTAETSNFAEKNHASGPQGYPEKQPLVAPTPPPVQRTSWLSCCGLFEAFTGSGR
ncbi:hypothetical protein CXB51_013977 [Gossypium anomalum]|uniref:Uncharacterized protein n=1 Tax=Gossypium anomalum TaxID=47600 RepID=A0A8J6CX70_9ROSI|nr:hypothetical protein CXB51_013977 [Gossypium anomalum]